MNKYDIGQIFEGFYPPEAAVWCDKNKAYIEELEAIDGVRRFQIVAIPELTLSELRTAALSRIDSATSAAILAGFDYTIEGETLHFSYDQFDQSNFSDTFNGVAMKKLMDIEELPETIDWNGWRNHDSENKGELVVLTLTPESFLALYTQGALVHKQTYLEIGKQRKKAIESAETVEEINNLMQEWEI